MGMVVIEVRVVGVDGVYVSDNYYFLLRQDTTTL